jgi:outer membrane protein TolC
MKNFIIAIAAIIVFAGGSLSALCQERTSDSQVLSLSRAISLALENNRSAKNAKLEVEKSADKVAQLRTRRLPSFTVSSLVAQPLSTFETQFDKGVFGTYPGIGPVPAETTSITSSTKPTALVVAQVSQPITQLRRIGLQIKQQEVGLEISQADLRAVEQGIVNDVKHAYYAILQTQGATVAAGESVKLYRELDRVTGEYVMQQVALKTDQMDVQTRLAKAEYQMLTLTNQLSLQKEQLNLLLGRDVTTPFTVTDELETAQVMMRETDLAQARQRALAQRPEIREAQLQVKKADLDRRAKKSEYIPDVSLTYNHISTLNYSDFMPRNVSSLGVQVEWEVFDWGRRKREVGEKTRTLSQATNSLLEAQSQVLIEVNDRYRHLQEACQQIRIARLSQTQATANVQMAAYKYRLDAVLLKDVLQAQTSLADANYDFQKALLTFWTAKADFEKAIGEDK